MVKGVARQVIVVRGPDRGIFDQAIFLVKEDAAAAGISEDDLLNEARMACRNARVPIQWGGRLLWSGLGAVATGLLWILTVI